MKYFCLLDLATLTDVGNTGERIHFWKRLKGVEISTSNSRALGTHFKVEIWGVLASNHSFL